MSRRDAVALPSTLAALSIWALTPISYLPGVLHSFLRRGDGNSGPTSGQDRHQYYFISPGFLITRIVGYSLTARWLFKSEPEIERLLPPIEITTNQN